MNRYLKKIMCGGLILGSIIPFTAKAAELSLGVHKEDIALTTIPISVKLTGDETVNNVTLVSCETDTVAVSCDFSVSGTGIISNKSNGGIVITYPNETNESSFPTNASTSLGNILLTNSSEEKYSAVTATITYKINGNELKLESKKYIVNGKKPKSDDATLKNVIISQGSINPAFNKDVMEYTIYDIADTINSIKFTPECNDGKCEISYEGGKSRTHSTGEYSSITLNQGNNDIKITVRSESGKVTNVYTFKTIRGESSYNSSNLSKLSVGIYTMEPAFVPNNYEYKITVPNKISSTSGLINFTPVDSNAKVLVDEVTDLKVGENVINVVVTNVLGNDAKTYKLIITRLSDDDIDITAYLNNKVTFTNSLGEEKVLGFTDFELQYPDEAKKITDGTYSFDDNGKRIHNEINKNDDKNDKKKKNKLVLIIILSIVGVAIIAISGILIFKKKKPKLPKGVKEQPKDEQAKEISEEESATEEEIIDEKGIEENIIGENFSKDKDATIDIDEALNDLMNTKQYDIDDKRDEN